MTPADLCSACPGCRSIHACRARCGVGPAGPAAPAPAIGLSWRGLLVIDAAAIGSLAALIAVPLRLCGAI